MLLSVCRSRARIVSIAQTGPINNNAVVHHPPLTHNSIAGWVIDMQSTDMKWVQSLHNRHELRSYAQIGQSQKERHIAFVVTSPFSQPAEKCKLGENQTSANQAGWIIFIGQTGCYQCYCTFHALDTAVRSGMIRSIIGGSKWPVRQKWATSPLSEMWLIEDHQLWTRYQQQKFQNIIRPKIFKVLQGPQCGFKLFRKQIKVFQDHSVVSK